MGFAERMARAALEPRAGVLAGTFDQRSYDPTTGNHHQFRMSQREWGRPGNPK